MLTLTKKWSNEHIGFKILLNDSVLFTVEDNDVLRHVGECLIKLSETEGNDSLSV